MSIIEHGTPHLNGIVQEGSFFFQRKDSLSPALLQAIHSGLSHYPHVVIDWNIPTTSIAEKLELLNSPYVFEMLDAADLHPQLKPKRAEHIRPFAMQTLTFEVEGNTGLLTTGVNHPHHKITLEEELLVIHNLARKKPAFAQKIQERAADNRSTRLKLGMDSEVDIHALGFAHGYVGPWLHNNTEMENYFVSPDFTEDDPNAFPVFDMALGNCESVLLFHPSHPQAVSRYVSEYLGGTMPITLHKKDMGVVREKKTRM